MQTIKQAGWLDPEFEYHPADSHKAGAQEFYERQIARGLVPFRKWTDIDVTEPVANVEFVQLRSKR